jgi:hypothetical protein
MTDNKYFVNGLLIAAFLFVVSYFLVGWNGRYQFTSSSGAGVWKIDTVTGQVWGCGSQDMTCRPLTNDPPTTD